MQLGQLLNPFIRQFQTGGDTSTPEGFEFLQGLEGGELERYLESKFGVKDASGMAQYFDPYSMAGEEQLQRQHGLGVKSAQMAAGAKMGDIYGKARAAGAKGGGFGGAGKAMQQAKGKTLGGLQQHKAKLGESLASGIHGEKQSFIDQFGSTVGTLGQYGAEFQEDTASTYQQGQALAQEKGCTPGQIWSEQEGCHNPISMGPDLIDIQGDCPEGQFQNADGSCQTMVDLDMDWSDIRVKHDITPIGHYKDYPMYTFRYNWTPNVLEVGVMAQEVEKINPKAVREINGIKAVNYKMILES